MNWSAELLRTRLSRCVGDIGAVIGGIAVGTPIALEGTGGHVDNRHPSIAITIGEIGFIGFDIDGNFRYAAEVNLAIAVPVFAWNTNGADVFAAASEDQHVGIAATVTAYPDIAIACDCNTVVGCRPGIFSTLNGSAPGIHHIAGVIKFDNRWRRRAAL